MVLKVQTTAGLVTVCCSMFAAISPVKEATMATHMLGLNFAMKPWAESLALMNVIMLGPYLKRTQLLYVIWWYHLWAACPCLSWSAVTFSRSISVELDSERSIVSTFLHERALLARVQIWNVRIYQFFKFKFSVYGHTYVCKQYSVRWTWVIVLF